MIAAFFDMDETLISVNSGRLWIKKLWRDGKLSKTDLVKSLGYIAGYRLAVLDMNRVAALAVARLEGEAESTMKADAMRWFEAEIRPHIIPGMASRVERHRTQEHIPVLLTASGPYVASPLAEVLDIEHVICSRFEVGGDGCFTGQLDGAFCYGDGKVLHAEAWAQEVGVDLSHSYFYTDSFTDLPMLNRVGNPVAVNADLRLRRHAKRRNIPSLDF